jgi:hypothetical protein
MIVAPGCRFSGKEPPQSWLSQASQEQTPGNVPRKHRVVDDHHRRHTGLRAAEQNTEAAHRRTERTEPHPLERNPAHTGTR